MKWLGQVSIYYKINGIIIGMLLLLSLIIGLFMITTTARLLEQQIEQQGAGVAAYIAALSSNDILLDDHYALFDRINKAKSNRDDVRYILITDSAGGILANTFAGDLPKGLPIRLPSNKDESSLLSSAAQSHGEYLVIKMNSNEGLIREIIVPIENGAIGFVRVGMSENSTQELLKEKLYEFFLTTFLVCLLAMIGATYLSSVIISPLRILTSAAGQIQQGNLSVQAAVKGEDEVGRLAAVFNKMVTSLQEKELENNRLLEELRGKEAMRDILLNKLFTIQEEERKRISRELHDETSQSLASLLAYMKVLLSRLTDVSQRELLLDARDVAISVLDGLRK
ncbi:MAG: HAMP domain-containing protein, partial [Sporomusaceae bacterium]|nr:HAMP domain-containing protein [Sporomusaceae bacterium]